MPKILEIVPTLEAGGIENIIYNYFCDKDKYKNYEIEFITHSCNGTVEARLSKLGYKIYNITPKKSNVFKYLRDINYIVAKGKYDIMHVHQNEMSFVPLLIGIIFGVRIRIVHMHSADFSKRGIAKIKQKLCGGLSVAFANRYWACGKNAARSLYGERIESVYIMHNAIDLGKYQRAVACRYELRKKLGLADDEYIIGQIGRFTEEKNHLFTIGLMSRLKGLNFPYKCVFIGDGPLKSKVQDAAIEKEIIDNLIFTGNVDNVEQYMVCMDLIILPSLHEGLPVTVIEAQAAGVKTIIADTITKEVCITPLVKMMPTTNDNLWIDEILKNRGCGASDMNAVWSKLTLEGYNIEYARESVFRKFDEYMYEPAK